MTITNLQLDGTYGVATAGNVTANFFFGDGGFLSNISGGGSTYSNANVTSLLSSGNVTTPITTTGNVNASFLNGNITTLTTGAAATAGSMIGTWTLGVGSTLQATYADLAERYSSDEQYEPGTVLAFGGSREVTLATSDTPTAVAGIVSSDPAYVLNAELEDSVVIALAGRVPCKVVGLIKRGDMLAVSHIPGVATSYYQPNYGTVFARAIESYNSAEVGLIEVKVDRG